MIGRKMALYGALWTPVTAATQIVFEQTCGLDVARGPVIDVVVADPAHSTGVIDFVVADPAHSTGAIDLVVRDPVHSTGIIANEIDHGLYAMFDAVQIALEIRKLTELIDAQKAAQIATEIEEFTKLSDVQQAARYFALIHSSDSVAPVSADEDTETDEEKDFSHGKAKKRMSPIYAVTFSGKFYSYNQVPFAIYFLSMDGVEHEIVVPTVAAYGQTEHCTDSMARKEACRIHPFRMLKAMKGIIPAVVVPVGVYIDFADPNRRNSRFRACFLNQLKAVLENEGCDAATTWTRVTSALKKIPAGRKPPKTRKKKDSHHANAPYVPLQYTNQLTTYHTIQTPTTTLESTLATPIPAHTAIPRHPPADTPDHNHISNSVHNATDIQTQKETTVPYHIPSTIHAQNATTIPYHTPTTIHEQATNISYHTLPATTTDTSHSVPYSPTKIRSTMYFQSFDTEDCLINHPLEPCAMSVECGKKRKYGR
jgi:hypothetical protein